MLYILRRLIFGHMCKKQTIYTAEIQSNMNGKPYISAHVYHQKCEDCGKISSTKISY